MGDGLSFPAVLDALMLVWGAAYFLFRLACLPSGSLLPPLPEENTLLRIDKDRTAQCPKCGMTGYLPMGLEKRIQVGDNVRAWVIHPRGLCYRCFGAISRKSIEKEFKIAALVYFLSLLARFFLLVVLGLSIETTILWTALAIVGVAPLSLLHWRLLVNKKNIESTDKDRRLLMDEAVKGAALSGRRPWE